MSKILCYIYNEIADFEITLLLHKLRTVVKREIIAISNTNDSITAQSGLIYTPNCTINELTNLSDIETLIIPGAPINNNQNDICELVKNLSNSNKLVAAICDYLCILNTYDEKNKIIAQIKGVCVL